jgi:hypothetical protein
LAISRTKIAIRERLGSNSLIICNRLAMMSPLMLVSRPGEACDEASPDRIKGAHERALGIRPGLSTYRRPYVRCPAAAVTG